VQSKLVLYYNDLVFRPSETFLQKDFGQVPYVLAEMHGLDLEYWIAAKHLNPAFREFRGRPVRQFGKAFRFLPARLDRLRNGAIRRALRKDRGIKYLLLFPFTPRTDLSVVRAALRAHPDLKLILKLDANRDLLQQMARDWEQAGTLGRSVRQCGQYRELLRLADAVLCETDECCALLRDRFLGLDLRRKLAQTFGGLSERWLAELGISSPPDAPRTNSIIVSGRISAPQKATSMIFSAGPPPPGWTIEFVGEIDERLAQEIAQARATDPRFDEHYRFHGAVRDKAAYFAILSRARALLMNSLGGEGFPNVFAEAHFCRLFILASETSGASEATGGGRYGATFQAGNVIELREALRRVPAMIERAAKNPVPEEFRRKFLWEHSLSQPAITRVFSGEHAGTAV
jgi:glycosyltransferase involved in cell wall biosynthesis